MSDKKQENGYIFNAEDDFTFLSIWKKFTCKVHFEKGHWWTSTPIEHKCTTLQLIKQL